MDDFKKRPNWPAGQLRQAAARTTGTRLRSTAARSRIENGPSCRWHWIVLCQTDYSCCCRFDDGARRETSTAASSRIYDGTCFWSKAARPWLADGASSLRCWTCAHFRLDFISLFTNVSSNSGMAPAAGSKPATVESVSKQGTAPAKAADDRTAVPALSGMTTISSQNQLAKPGTLADLYNIERTGPGQALTADELQKMREEGKLTHDIDITMNPALYKLKDEKGQEKLIVSCCFDFIRFVTKGHQFWLDFCEDFKFYIFS